MISWYCDVTAYGPSFRGIGTTSALFEGLLDLLGQGGASVVSS